MIAAIRPYLAALLVGLAASSAVGLAGCNRTEVGTETITPGDPASDRDAREASTVKKK